MKDRIGALSRVACTIYFIISGTLRAGTHTLKDLISAARKTCKEGLFAELLLGAQVLFFIQGPMNEILGEDSAPQFRMEKLEELLQRGDGIIELPSSARASCVQLHT